ncbi:MAG: NAD(P)/FAD-dependent oxidoreductase [Aquabacterium sp.]
MSTTATSNRCDVLVIGAGPAGSACAQWLARHGLDVLLADKEPFPRDKTCGDGLIPDSLAALRRLGVYEEVMAVAQPVSHVGCIGPRGGRVDVPGTMAVLPRRQLDNILCRAAQRAGARFEAPLRFDEPLRDAAGRVIGARCTGAAGSLDIQARWLVLATGAPPQAMLAAGLCDRRQPTGIALRGYVHHPGMVGRITALEVVWHPRLKGGYGWIFPCGHGVFNIGAGVVQGHAEVRDDGRAAKRDLNLRQVFNAFTECYPPAAELMAGGTLQGEIKGAPLRCGLSGARSSADGVLATGEAIGTTYDFSGEGIGKAMETGILAAEALLAGRPEGLADAAVRSHYDAALARLKPRFNLYEKANRVNQYPWLADLLIWRARRSPRLLQRMSGVLNETSNPGNLLSFKGFSRVFLE